MEHEFLFLPPFWLRRKKDKERERQASSLVFISPTRLLYDAFFVQFDFLSVISISQDLLLHWMLTKSHPFRCVASLYILVNLITAIWSGKMAAGVLLLVDPSSVLLAYRDVRGWLRCFSPFSYSEGMIFMCREQSRVEERSHRACKPPLPFNLHPLACFHLPTIVPAYPLPSSNLKGLTNELSFPLKISILFNKPHPLSARKYSLSKLNLIFLVVFTK